MKTLEPFFNVLLNNWPGLACLLGIYVLIEIITSPTYKGWFGEKYSTQNSMSISDELN